MVVIFVLSLVTPTVSVDAEPQLPKLSVDPPIYIATQLGEVFIINIRGTNIADLKGFEFKLGYNTSLLDALDAVEGSLPEPPIQILKQVNDTEGYIWVSILCNPTGGNGTLATITFNTTSAEPASSTLHLYDTYLIDSSADPIPHQVEDGEYQFAILTLNVATDKQLYSISENVTIHGNLTLGNVPQQVLVAVEVDNPYGLPLVIRTLQTGPLPPSGEINIIEVYPSNQWGDPKDTFTKGEAAYFYVAVRNNGTQTKTVTITVNAFDASMTPLPIPSWTRFPLAPKSQAYTIVSIYIPDWANAGNGTAYASVLTDFPSQGGTPYCPEKNATFQITGGGAGPGASGPSALPGNYNLTFKLANDTISGVYRTYVISSHLGRILTNNTVFGVNTIAVPYHYPTIQQAVDAATPTNNSIMVLPGTYNEQVTINKSVTLAGAHASTTIINGTGTGNVVTVTASNVKIIGFTIQNSGTSTSNSGLILVNSSNSIIDNNILSNNNYGIYLNRSASISLRDNSMLGNKHNLGVFGDLLSHFTHDIETSNTVDGKPLIYWVNKQDQTVPSNAGFVAIVNSTRIMVNGLQITKEGQGLLLAFTTDSIIQGVNVSNNAYGIYLVNSNGNNIVGSKVSNNTVGVYQRYCNQNIIYHNNFVDNTNQVDLYQSSNTWDNGDGEGNYWSDYTGLDDGSNGRIAGDGVGDTLLPHQDVDWYPLMNFWVPKHDVAITNVTHMTPYNTTYVYPGMVISVTATAKNRGDFAETFNVIAYYDGNPVDTKQIGLVPQEETVVYLTWDTTGVSSGNYTISVRASQVPGETYLDNNIFADGNVTVLEPTIHDVAPTNVTPWKNKVYRGLMINVTVVVKNQGHFTETFNVTAYANTTVIDTETVTLRPLADTNLTFTWNTTDAALSQYRISAETSTVPGENDTANNIFIDGMVEVALWGDVNGNGIVDLGDIGKVILIYSGIITEPQWMIERADLNGNGVVDLGDIGKIILIYSGLL